MSEPPASMPHPGEPFFGPVAEHLGEAYLRYDFTRGTRQEVEFLLEELRLKRGARLLDVGCGPGRHAVAFAQAGLAVTGVDVSARFLEIAAKTASEAGVKAAFFECDARQMPFGDEFDAVVSICQGGFGLMGGDDSVVLRRMAEATKANGKVILTAFNAYYSARHQTEANLDADMGVVHERTVVRSEEGAEKEVDLWTSVFTPRELRLMTIGVGLIPEAVYSVSPGAYARNEPSAETPEFLMVARKPPPSRKRR
ncbi:MAG: class I SAM-dependent methyltransferase [Actinomycetota bacterium]